MGLVFWVGNGRMGMEKKTSRPFDKIATFSLADSGLDGTVYIQDEELNLPGLDFDSWEMEDREWGFVGLLR